MLIFASLLAGYIFVRGILPLRIHWGWKAGLSIALLLTAFKFHILYLFGGPMFFAPDFPGFLLLGSAWLFASVFIFFFLLIAADLVRLVLLLYLLCTGKKRTERFRIIGNRVNAGLLAFSFLLATIGITGGTAVPEVREENVYLPNLPEKLDGMTIAVIVDLHADGLTRADRIQKIVEMTNALQSDVIVLCGDFVDGVVPVHGKELLPLKKLSAKYGVFGIPGNHEYYSGYGEWMKFLPGLGIKMLENSHVMLPEGTVAIAGVTDPTAVRFGLERPDIGKAFAGILPAGALKILLSHQPRLAPEAERHGADLQISGHTHGGMIPGLDLLVARFNGGFVSGFYRVGNMPLYVSRGSGIWNGFPIRIGVPAEITWLHLHRKK